MAKKSKKAELKEEEIVYKPLGENLKIGGFALDLVQREGDVAIFKKSRIKKAWCDFYEAGYEVGIIKRHKGYNLGSQYIGPAETWPCNSLFGVLGWSFQELRDAEFKFRELLHAIKTKTLTVSEEETSTESEDEKE